MTSNRPYLIRAFYEWIIDNDLTPLLLVDAQAPGVLVPKEHIRDGQITLNTHPSAVHGLQLGNDWIEFKARFGGVARGLQIPVAAVLAIYARENSHGMIFGPEPDDQDPPAPDSPPEPPKPARRAKPKPALKIVK